MRTDKNALLTYKKVKYLTTNLSFSNIIDLGCGDTELLSEIKEKKSSLNINSINYVGAGYEVKQKNKDINVINLLDFNKSNWDKFVEEKFDFILALDVIEHLENPFCFLKQLKKISKINTKILITIPNIHSYRSRIKFFLTGRPSAFFNKDFRLSNKRNFDHHIWIPAIDLIKYYLRCNNLNLNKIHHIYGNNIFTSHTLLLEIDVKD